MGVISLEHMDRLYWLGRYTERVYTTIRVFADSFDKMIDLDMEDFADYCERQEIPNIYTSEEDFSERYCFDTDNPNSIFANLYRAYDNAIVLREAIGSEALAYIQLAIYDMNKAKNSDAPLIELQSVIDKIVAFWGIADDDIDDEKVRNIIKAGKRVERIDLYARLHMAPAEIRREVIRLNHRIPTTGLEYNNTKLMHINYLAELEPMDYKTILEEIESMMEV